MTCVDTLGIPDASSVIGLPRGGSRRLAPRRQSSGPSARRTEAVIGSPRRLAADAVIGSPRGSCGSAHCIAAASRSRFAGNFDPQQQHFGSFRDGGAAARPLRYFGFRALQPVLVLQGNRNRGATVFLAGRAGGPQWLSLRSSSRTLLSYITTRVRTSCRQSFVWSSAPGVKRCRQRAA